MAPKGGLLPVQNQMYGAMAEALLKGMVPPPHKERSAVRRLEAGELPKLRGNEFYAESRWFYKPPEEPDVPLCTACVECPLLNPSKCEIKCYSCAKFDPLGKGHFCGSCFKTRHPSYRQAHTFLPIGEVEDLEGAAKAQRVTKTNKPKLTLHDTFYFQFVVSHSLYLHILISSSFVLSLSFFHLFLNYNM